ncbi:Os02g0141150 [Oryza sativa Japonica Group]|uniref:Os02g0141150 protein n=1 Tax=Oryza sativa subsp. japonica TaxID=39947 RepID=A0A0P0VEL7_ORYSJ|nr:Os02g0141150 [Oryza sativa Japonica Group]
MLAMAVHFRVLLLLLLHAWHDRRAGAAGFGASSCQMNHAHKLGYSGGGGGGGEASSSSTKSEVRSAASREWESKKTKRTRRGGSRSAAAAAAALASGCSASKAAGVFQVRQKKISVLLLEKKKY